MAWPTTSRQSRGYDREHERQRAALLAREPLCRECAKRGLHRRARFADHIVPRSQGGRNVADNYQPLCGDCHLTKTVEEKGHRRVSPVGTDGLPTDPRHPWNR